jgi:hypothetical protein
MQAPQCSRDHGRSPWEVGQDLIELITGGDQLAMGLLFAGYVTANETTT